MYQVVIKVGFAKYKEDIVNDEQSRQENFRENGNEN
jgi:hypothetical protein